MPLHSADILEETPAPHAEPAPAVNAVPDPLARDATPPEVQVSDSIQLLLQSPHKLFLYWTLARDADATLREAFGALAAHYRLMVRLVKVESGEEFLLEAAQERMQWFDVYPRHAYRADVGFHAEHRPFVRLLSSHTVHTPPDSVSPTIDVEPEFQLKAEEFARVLRAAGYERYAITLTPESGDLTVSHEDAPPADAEQQGAVDVPAPVADINEYPHH